MLVLSDLLKKFSFLVFDRSCNAEAEYLCGGVGYAVVLAGVAEFPAEACRPCLH